MERAHPASWPCSAVLLFTVGCLFPLPISAEPSQPVAEVPLKPAADEKQEKFEAYVRKFSTTKDATELKEALYLIPFSASKNRLKIAGNLLAVIHSGQQAMGPPITASLNVSPPRESGLPSGVALSAIDDPKVRKAYETAIAENSKKIAALNRRGEIGRVVQEAKAEAEAMFMEVRLREKKEIPDILVECRKLGFDEEFVTRLSKTLEGMESRHPALRDGTGR